jgi:hypothetical protein
MRGRLGQILTVALIAAVTLFAQTAPEALANHVHCGDSITADTVLDSDLSCSQSIPGIEIGADAVTLDLNGHLLSHRDAGPGILNPGFEDVTIQNGVIQTEVSYGILLNDADRNTLRGLQVVHLPFGNDATSPARLNRSDEALIERNGFYGWTGALGLVESNGGVITGNRTGYFRCALEGECSGFATGGGVGLTASDDNVVEGNWFGQGISGFGTGSDRNLFRGNTVTLSIATGFLAWGGEDNVAEKNEVSHNGANGISTLGGTRNRIEKNAIFENGLDGIVAAGPSTLIVHNVVRGNRDDGIEVFDPGVVVERNRVIQNRDLGIEAVPGVVDGGSNKASGNGNPLQCVNVVCK